MSGERRLTEPKPKPSRHLSDINFGLVAMVLLAMLAMVIGLKYPELLLPPGEILGP
jgi:hypothetical protein